MLTSNARLGLVLFSIYLLLYGGFVLLAAFAPQSMEIQLLGGVTLAIWYGFGLIIAAFILALFYGCTAKAAIGEPDVRDADSRSEP